MADNKEFLMLSEDNGSVYISEDVVSSIAAVAAMEVEGVNSLASNTGKELGEKINRKNLAKGIRLTVSENSVSLECCLVLNFGYDLVEVAKAVQESVTNAIVSMTGFRVERVDVSVSGVSMEK